MKRLALRVETGEKAGQVFEVVSGGLHLGRSSANNMQLLDEELSRNHCLFEATGETGVCVTDLASANGTFVNGERLGAQSVELKAGDVIAVGASRLTVVGEGAATESRQPETEPPPKKPLPPLKSMQPERGSFLGKFLWIVALAAAGWTLWSHRATVLPYVERLWSKEASAVASPVKSFSYERVAANTGSVYRVALDFGEDGLLRLQVDDVPAANRHEKQSEKLGQDELKALLALFDDAELSACAGDLGGSEANPQELDSRTLSVVEASRSWRIRVVNAPMPEAFRRFCEKLEQLTGIGSR